MYEYLRNLPHFSSKGSENLNIPSDENFYFKTYKLINKEKTLLSTLGMSHKKIRGHKTLPISTWAIGC